jgi:hypothetical protein
MFKARGDLTNYPGTRAEEVETVAVLKERRERLQEKIRGISAQIRHLQNRTRMRATMRKIRTADPASPTS